MMFDLRWAWINKADGGLEKRLQYSDGYTWFDVPVEFFDEEEFETQFPQSRENETEERKTHE